MNEKTRRLPRHVDGRIKIGPFPVKNFFMWLPIGATIALLAVKNFSEWTLGAGIILIGVSGFMFIEFKNKETGFDMMKTFFKYELRPLMSLVLPDLFPDKKIMLERSVDDVPIVRRFIFNKGVQEIRNKKEQHGKEQESEQG